MYSFSDKEMLSLATGNGMGLKLVIVRITGAMIQDMLDTYLVNLATLLGIHII